MGRVARYLIVAFFAVTCFISGYDYGIKKFRCDVIETSDTIIITDTITSIPDTIYAVRYLGDRIVKVQHYDTIHKMLHDTIEVALPITQKEYRDSSYHAWVSGYDAVLDSISVFPKTKIIENTRVISSKTSRFGVFGGISVGIGKNGVQPCLGVGIGIKLF